MSGQDPHTGPSRFSETRAPGAPHDPDARIGALLRRVPPPLPIPQARLERVAFGIMRRGERRARSGRRWALVGVLLFGVSGLVFARDAREPRELIGRLWRSLGAPASVPAPEAPPPANTAGPATERAAPQAPAAAAAPAITRAALVARPAPLPRAPIARAPAPARRHERAMARRRLALVEPTAPPDPQSESAPPAPGPARARTPLLAPPDGTNVADVIKQPLAPLAAPPARSSYRRLGEETAVLRRALQNLRHDDDAAGALDALDEYDRRFPFGVLRPNAQLVRIDALVALGRHDEALALLQAVDLQGNPRADDLEITRGELRARRDCRAAMADFSRALARTPDDALFERALRGRALCAHRLDDEAAMRADLTRYLQRFPHTPFAARARALLAQ